VGKSTLLNILLGNLVPESGKVIIGTKLQVAYFDQLRKTLELDKTVIENVVQGSDMIEINGSKRHIISYLGDFLFTPQRSMTPVKSLSGGESNRLLLAKLFSQPANLLVLDEPTNDLDIETLELLEELLSDYPGTLLLVSHDRAFLDNVVTSTLIFEGDGKIEEYIGGYQDWVRQKKLVEAKPQAKQAASKAPEKKAASGKLTYQEQKELQELPKKIEKLEADHAEWQTKMGQPDFYQQDAKVVQEQLEKYTTLAAELAATYKRWELLEEKAETTVKK